MPQSLLSSSILNLLIGKERNPKNGSDKIQEILPKNNELIYL